MLTNVLQKIYTRFRHTLPAAKRIAVQPGRRPKAAWLRAIPFLAPVMLLALAGCAQPPAALAGIPVTGSAFAPARARLEVCEYALVEQSKDNPTHLGFQERVPAAVAAERSGWQLPGLEAAVNAPNRLLAEFGFRLAPNQSPPFGGYTLYHHETALRSDIADFWPVSQKFDPAYESRDFLLPFVTQAGEKLVASSAGIYPWPAAVDGQVTDTTPPVYYGDQIAYAQSDSGVLSVFAGPSLLYSEPDAHPAEKFSRSPRTLITWGGETASEHWALELDGRVIVDGQELNDLHDAEQVYEFNVIDGRPLYFAERGGQAALHFDGRDLPYIYDHIERGNAGDLAVFNPGSSGRVIWFYALRDGLWYYVEAGIFD